METSSDPALAKLGSQIKAEKRDPKLAVPADKAGDNPAGQVARHQHRSPEPKQETASNGLIELKVG